MYHKKTGERQRKKICLRWKQYDFNDDKKASVHAVNTAILNYSHFELILGVGKKWFISEYKIFSNLIKNCKFHKKYQFYE